MAQLVVRHTETSGDLTWISQQWQQPIQRMFWLHELPAHSLRGGHHHQADCQMVLQCVRGRVSVYVQTPEHDHYYTLQASHQYLFLGGSDWRLMHEFSADAVLTVLTSHRFEQTIYIAAPYRPVAAAIKEANPLF